MSVQNKQPLNVREYYKGKNILLSGSTGFIGKVILEKLLRSCPELGCVYVMIRPKTGMDLMERLKNEILTSRCFDEIRYRNKDFQTFFKSKIVPVASDLTKDGLGLSESDKNMLI